MSAIQALVPICLPEEWRSTVQKREKAAIRDLLLDKRIQSAVDSWLKENSPLIPHSKRLQQIEWILEQPLLCVPKGFLCEKDDKLENHLRTKEGRRFIAAAQEFGIIDPVTLVGQDPETGQELSAALTPRLISESFFAGKINSLDPIKCAYLHTIDPNIIADFNEHATSGLSLNCENIWRVINHADFLGINSVLLECSRYLERHFIPRFQNAYDLLQDPYMQSGGIVDFLTEVSPSLKRLIDSRVLGWLERADSLELLSTRIDFLFKKSFDLYTCNFVSPSAPSAKNILDAFTNLRVLSLRSCPVLNDDIIPSLARLARLEEFEMIDAELTDQLGVAVLCFSELQKMRLHNCPKITHAIVQYLEPLEHFFSLSLEECDGVTDGIGPLLVRLKWLTSLNLKTCKKVRDIGAHLAQLTSLEELSLQTRLPDSTIFALSGLPSLRQLTLCQTDLNEGIKPIVDDLKQRGVNVSIERVIGLQLNELLPLNDLLMPSMQVKRF